MNESFQHALVIVNPHSRNGQAEILNEAVSQLERSGFKVSLCESENEAHLNSLIKNYQTDNGIIVIAGGDGTVSSALDAIYTCERTVAIFPMGTANDFARSIGVPQDPVEAAKVLINGKRERVNLGRVDDTYFINVAHVGLGVDVTHELTSEKKKHYGIFAYIRALAKALKYNKSFKVTIQSDEGHETVRAIHLAIGNGRFYGGGNIVDEASSLRDGHLNLFCIKAQRWWQLLLLGPSLRRGKLRMKNRILNQVAQHFHIHTDTPRELEADGESKTTTPADIEVIPNAIEVIVGELPLSSE